MYIYTNNDTTKYNIYMYESMDNFIRIVWRYTRYTQKPQIEEEQIWSWPKEQTMIYKQMGSKLNVSICSDPCSPCWMYATYQQSDMDCFLFRHFIQKTPKHETENVAKVSSICS
jgi:hypothetical protein